MKVLVVNCGSSTIKYKLFDLLGGEKLRESASGLLDRVGAEMSTLTHRRDGDTFKLELKARDHREGLEAILKILTSGEYGVIRDLSEVYAVGHRVVHGGDSFFKSTLVTDKVLKVIKEWSEMAPLHNPANIAGIEAAMALMPDTPQVAVFDTAFHQTMPVEAYLYAIPYELYENYKIRRYGFHGTSHRYVAQKAAEVLGTDLSNLKMVTCHLGAGCSITAVKGGKSIDTSMGFTPLEGLVMATRSGDVDPSIIFFLVRRCNMTLDEVENLLNRESGLKGLSGISGDVRDLRRELDRGNKMAEIALKVFAYRVKKYIGAYTAAMGGLDAIIFTAGIGENDWRMREAICEGLEALGVEIDPEKNRAASREPRVVSRDSSKVKVLVIPTDEELAIALETISILSESSKR
ncbi:acetate kinase [Candidatus Bathyarchaeota archaeon]|nr:MAG: acetate kinase [Candidatus Bathyarchaeota archaeon]